MTQNLNLYYSVANLKIPILIIVIVALILLGLGFLIKYVNREK